MRYAGLLFAALCVISLVGFGQTLSGTWSLSADIKLAAVDWISLSSSLSVDYVVGEWSFASSSSFGMTGWSSQSFSTSGALGRFALSSSLDFDPSAVSFKK